MYSVIFLVGLFALTSCSNANSELSDPQLNVYLLDLTGSGSTSDQLRRIYSDIENDITVDSLGQPYLEEEKKQRPVISQVFFVGTNSRYLFDFTLQNYESIKNFYEFNNKENNSSNAERIWNQIGGIINSKLGENINEEIRAISKSECKTEINMSLEDLFSESKRKDYVRQTCEIILYSSKQYFDFKNYVEVQSKLQSHSDVFGAMSAINDKVGQFLTKFPNGRVKIIMASDGDHNIKVGEFKDLKSAIQENQDICAYAQQLGASKSFNYLSDERVDMSDKPGVGALGADSSSTAEYANKLSQFWNCFPK